MKQEIENNKFKKFLLFGSKSHKNHKYRPKQTLNWHLRMSRTSNLDLTQKSSTTNQNEAKLKTFG